MALTVLQDYLPKVVEHFTFNLRNILTPWWSDRRLYSLQMNLCEKPRQVHTCLTVYPESSAAFGGAIIPISLLGRIKISVYNRSALLGLFFNAGGFS